MRRKGQEREEQGGSERAGGERRMGGEEQGMVGREGGRKRGKENEESERTQLQPFFVQGSSNIGVLEFWRQHFPFRRSSHRGVLEFRGLMKARGSQERSSPSLQSLAQSPDAAKTEVDSEGSDVSYLTVLSEEDRPKKEETEKPTTQKTQRGPRRRWWTGNQPGAGGSCSRRRRRTGGGARDSMRPRWPAAFVEVGRWTPARAEGSQAGHGAGDSCRSCSECSGLSVPVF